MSVKPKTGRSVLAALALVALLAQSQAADAQLQINVVLTTLDAGGLDDGIADRDVEAYGTFTIGPVAVRWNNHLCEPRFGRGCIITTPPPYTTTIRSGRRNWSAMSLSFDARGFRTSNNIIWFTRTAAETALPLIVSFRLRDHDDASRDDTWCRASNVVLVAPGLTLATWLRTTTTPIRRSIRASGPDGFCTIGFTITAQRLSLSP